MSTPTATPSAPAAPLMPKPLVLPETAAYWQAADEGRLLVQRCLACRETHHYPRDICPCCLSDGTEWHTCAGAGTVYAFSTMGSGAAAHTMAFVTLDEGLAVMINLVHAEPSTWRIGQRVKVVFLPSEGGPAVPVFEPA